MLCESAGGRWNSTPHRCVRRLNLRANQSRNKRATQCHTKKEREKYMAERLTTGEICTRSVTIAFRGTSLNGAARLMRENHVGCLVVVDEVGGMRIVVGVLTDRDIVTAVVASDLDPSTLHVEDVMLSL